MSIPTTARRGRRAFVLATVAGVAAATLATSGGAQAITSPAAAAPAAGTTADGGKPTPLKAGKYIVTMVAPPAATYGGGVAGMAATRPARGKRLDAKAPAVAKYRQHLLGQQSSLLKSVGVKPSAQYTVTLNGFAAQLSAAQATKLASNKGVISVAPAQRRTPDLFDTPRYLGLQGATGTWNQVGGVDKAGKGVVVGVLDTGVWPENPFFGGAPVRRTTPGGVGSTYTKDGVIHVVKKDGGEFAGACQAGTQFYATTCNNKLVGARYYADGFLDGDAPADVFGPYEFLSPRDGDGHGSHTASTAAGNQITGMCRRRRLRAGRRAWRPRRSSRSTRSAGTAPASGPTAATTPTCVAGDRRRGRATAST